MSLINQVLQDLDRRSEPAVTIRLPNASPLLEDNMDKTVLTKIGFVLLSVAAVGLLIGVFQNVSWPQEEVVNVQPSVVLVDTQSTSVLVKSAKLTQPETPIQIDKQVLTPVVVSEPAPIRDKPKPVQTKITKETWLPQQAPNNSTDTPVIVTPVETVSTPVVIAPVREKVLKISPVLKVKADDFSRAKEAIKKGQLALAEPLLMSYINTHADNVDAMELLVGLYLRNGRNAQAELLIERAIKVDPSHQKLGLIHARLLVDKGEKERAIQLLNSTVSGDSASPNALQLLGALFNQDKRFTEALSAYDKLLAITPKSSAAWLGLALAMDGLKDANAAQAYRQALVNGGLNQASTLYATQRFHALSEG